MMKINFLILSLSINLLFTQNTLKGIIKYENKNNIYPFPGVNLFWIGTDIMTFTDSEGNFELDLTPNSNLLGLSHIGFKTDTIRIKSLKTLDHIMSVQGKNELDEVIINQTRKTIKQSFFETRNVINVSSEELLKAACCNLSESFDTNPAIDVNYSYQ